MLGTDQIARDLYLDLLKRTLTRDVFEDSDEIIGFRTASGRRQKALHRLGPALGRFGLELVRKRPYDADARRNGLDWPSRAETMIGLKRLDNLQDCIEAVIRDDVPGDLIETGVWRGGASIFMRGVLAAHGVTDRTVWCADSFEGLPPPDAARYPADAGDDHHTFDALAVGVDQVRHAFRRYHLLDDQVQFLVGYFRDTLTDAPVDRLAVLRMDGDMYESTVQAIGPLYPKLQPGGFCIVDDYRVVPGCKQAVDEYRAAHGITAQVVDIDGVGVYWRAD
jgi:O-methyltransferase